MKSLSKTWWLVLALRLGLQASQNNLGIHVLELIVSSSLRKADVGKSIDTESVYFVDLVHNTAVGFNENMAYAPASLLKVANAMALLRSSEDNPAILSRRLTVDSSSDGGFVQNIAPYYPVEIGKTYSIEHLIANALRYSDNRAYVTLTEYLGHTNFRAMQDLLFADFNIDTNMLKSAEDFISPRQYSSFLVALYSGSFLNREYSDKAIKMLSESEFAEGLEAGVPSDVLIAHKFGERGSLSGAKVQLHDCGIVFNGTSPYVLCVMTKGRSRANQAFLIHAISKGVYNAVNNVTLLHKHSDTSQNSEQSP